MLPVWASVLIQLFPELEALVLALIKGVAATPGTAEHAAASAEADAKAVELQK